MNHIKGFDTLKAFAIIFLILEHWWIPADIWPGSAPYYWIKALVPSGGFGLSLLFVLNGFLITNGLMSEKKTKPKLKIIKEFYIKKSLRFLPIYFILILILMAIGYPFIQDNISYFILFTSNMLIYADQAWNDFAYTWPIAVGVQFYLIWPWIITFVKEKYLPHAFITVIILSIFTSVLTILILNNWAGVVLMPTCMQAFAIGGFYAYLMKYGKLSYFTKFISTALPIAMFFYFYWCFFPEIGVKYNYLSLTINSIICIWLIDKTINNGTKWANDYILENRLLNKIGKMSFGLFLFYFSMLSVYGILVKALITPGTPAEVFFMDWKKAYYIKLLLLLGFASLSYRFIEKPIYRINSRLIK